MVSGINKEAKKRHIVQSAATVFARKGFHATKMQEIADQAEVGKGTLYEYFRTKETLFLAVYDEWIATYLKTIRDKCDAATGALGRADAIRESAIEFYRSRAAEAPLLLEFWAHSLRSTNPDFKERIHRLRTTLVAIGKQITEELVLAGFFVPVQTDSFALLETGISDGIFLAWVLSDQSFDLSSAYVFRQSVIGNGLLAAEARGIISSKLEQKLNEGFSPGEL